MRTGGILAVTLCRKSRAVMAMAVYWILLPAILTSFFALSSPNQPDFDRFLGELEEAKLTNACANSTLKESIQKLQAKWSLYLKEREEWIQDMDDKIQYPQSALSNLKDDLPHADERLKTLEEEMVEIVTEQWFQIQHLEQALEIAKIRALEVQRQSSMRCTLLKFINDLSEVYLPRFPGQLGSGFNLASFISQTLEQFKSFFSSAKKYHHEFQAFIKMEMVKNEFTAALANNELVFYLASTLLIFPLLSAWMLLSSLHG
ncbi:hypothetical protein SLA2020_523330 [Shorea laevis]